MSCSGVDDPLLLTRARAGDMDACEQLFERHRPVAISFALSLSGPSYAEDLVSEAFANVLSAMQRGLGPTISFRSYLLTSIRAAWANTVRRESRYDLVADYGALPLEPLTVSDDPDGRLDDCAIREAFKSLPERWQAVLCYSTVEGRSHAETGKLLGINANAVAALGHRAREGLRRAYLSQQNAATIGETCRRMPTSLPAQAHTAAWTSGSDRHPRVI